MSMGKFGIGQAVTRFEDRRLLRGEGRFQNDVNLPGQTHAVVVRSVHAHARIGSIDTRAAASVPGVLAVLTSADLAAAGLGTMQMTLKRKRPDGSPMWAPPHHGLARDRVRYVGDPVVLVIADTLGHAEDAAQLVQIDYEPLPSVTATADAVGGAPVWDECPDNISNLFEVGDKAVTDAAFARAHRVVRRRYAITRVHAQYMEARGALGVYDRGEDRYILYADVQYPHRVRNALASNILKVPEHKIRVIAGDVGGGFGTKGWQYPEHRLVLWAARKLGRPVKWQCERREAIPADEHARDNVSDAELALDAEGRFLALRVRTLANVGAYVSSDRNLLATFSNVPTLVGVYAIPAAHVQVTSVLTNTNSTAPYRGAGRPEATYVIERLIDDAARELALDPVELRRKNLIPSSAMPYRTPLGVTYDCGDFDKNMADALKLGDVAGFAARREASRARGALRGIAVVNPIERAAGPQPEFAEIRFSPSGSATVLMGSKNQGQGHETTFKQILHERLGLDPAEVRYIDGDTDRVAWGMGTMGSRSTVIGGTALWTAADKVIAKGKKIAAKLLEAAEPDIVFAEGRFAVAGTDRAVSIKEVARAAFQPAQLPAGVEPGLYETGTFSPKQDTWPNGCHVCEVEVDPETGAVTIVNYVVVDDVGTVINPLTLKGQIHGGVAQGVGQALMEQVVYDRESGQLLTTSFMEYAMPRADTLCDMHIESNPVPTKLNPLGAKGAGEAGTVGALPAVINAVVDALAAVGVREFDMPATGDRVWQAIQAVGTRQ
ncbi:MAG TPA: xanthine dehydrogenase family protein molybdopterin-binding subunit [Methylomirabilota bacterium]|jgi:carbon-monoxide dehydrogenase large subunit|nr:xanthine dehydrogenase family protein molybdopterin-binding subunit [Methylomirabilota bacterium]